MVNNDHVNNYLKEILAFVYYDSTVNNRPQNACTRTVSMIILQSFLYKSQRFEQSWNFRFAVPRNADARLCLFYKIVNNMVAVPLPNYVKPSLRTSERGYSKIYWRFSLGRTFICTFSFHWQLSSRTPHPTPPPHHASPLSNSTVSSLSLDIFKAEIGRL